MNNPRLYTFIWILLTIFAGIAYAMASFFNPSIGMLVAVISAWFAYTLINATLKRLIALALFAALSFTSIYVCWSLYCRSSIHNLCDRNYFIVSLIPLFIVLVLFVGSGLYNMILSLGKSQKEKHIS